MPPAADCGMVERTRAINSGTHILDTRFSIGAMITNPRKNYPNLREITRRFIAEGVPH